MRFEAEAFLEAAEDLADLLEAKAGRPWPSTCGRSGPGHFAINVIDRSTLLSNRIEADVEVEPS